jgi:hypothetical protein
MMTPIPASIIDCELSHRGFATEITIKCWQWGALAGCTSHRRAIGVPSLYGACSLRFPVFCEVDWLLDMVVVASRLSKRVWTRPHVRDHSCLLI